MNDSPNGLIRIFDIGADGMLSGGDIWAEVSGDQPVPKWVPDGMKLDVDSNLFCNGPNGVHIFTPDAKCLGVINIPEKSANFCFGGRDRDRLYVTASTRLYRIKTLTSGPSMIPGTD